MSTEGLPTIEWTPHVLSTKDVLVLNGAQLLADHNSPDDRGRVISTILRHYWQGSLSLYKLRPLLDCRYNNKGGYFERIVRQDTTIARSEEIDSAKECVTIGELFSEQTVIVDDCRRGQIPREVLLWLMKFPLGTVDNSFLPDRAGFNAVASLEPHRAYGEELEGLAELWAYATDLAALCEQEGLECPPEFGTQKKSRKGIGGRPPHSFWVDLGVEAVAWMAITVRPRTLLFSRNTLGSAVSPTGTMSIPGP
jgi:hypothetical protein